MADNNITFRFEDVPKGYVFCFLDCPLSSRCVLHRAGETVPDGTKFGYAVFPTARQGESCSMFKELRVIRGAWGFDRAEVKGYLGGNGSYSRYKLGRRLLTPEQQRDILDIFRRYGYTEETQFDHYVDVVDF